MHYPQARRFESLSARISPRFAPPLLTQLDGWQVIRHLGSGASAQVWLIKHDVSQQELACKIPHRVEDHSLLSQEAKLAQTLHHENFVQVIEEQRLDGLTEARHAGATFWEFLPAGSLGTLISAGGALSVAETVTVLLPMLQIGEYLQTQQIVHGDFSPANIMFDLTGRPVLIDLGAVRATAHGYNIMGTPGFVAPELEEPNVTVAGLGAAADVYSLAAIGWFCLTAESPGSPRSRMPLQILQPELDLEIVEILEACLSTEPALRPSLSQFQDAVALWAKPKPVDLFAAAGEELELLLPTRIPSEGKAPRRRLLNRSRLRSRADRSKKHPQPTDARSPRPRNPWRRVFLGLGSLCLLATVVGTSIHVGQTPTHYDTVDDTQVQVQGAEDFQAVVDELAHARSQAWAENDTALVSHYAAEDSTVSKNDLEVLTQLQQAGTVLEGIRMRAVVEDTRHIPRETIVEVDWRIDGYIQRDLAGEVVQTVPARSDRLVLVLCETTQGWRLRSAETL